MNLQAKAFLAGVFVFILVFSIWLVIESGRFQNVSTVIRLIFIDCTLNYVRKAQSKAKNNFSLDAAHNYLYLDQIVNDGTVVFP